jgi:hypothetical protein
MGTQQEKDYGFGGDFYALDNGRRNYYENSSACNKKRFKILWVPIMPGTQILWVRDFFYV